MSKISSQAGEGFIELALVLVLVAIVLIVILVLLGPEIGAFFESLRAYFSR